MADDYKEKEYFSGYTQGEQVQMILKSIKTRTFDVPKGIIDADPVKKVSPTLAIAQLLSYFQTNPDNFGKQTSPSASGLSEVGTGQGGGGGDSFEAAVKKAKAGLKRKYWTSTNDGYVPKREYKKLSKAQKQAHRELRNELGEHRGDKGGFKPSPPTFKYGKSDSNVMSLAVDALSQFYYFPCRYGRWRG
jgi:hypothetical protein